VGRKVAQIDQQKCNGCGSCVLACRKKALAFAGIKAKLEHPDLCDGGGDCLPVCLTGAITLVEAEG